MEMVQSLQDVCLLDLSNFSEIEIKTLKMKCQNQNVEIGTSKLKHRNRNVEIETSKSNFYIKSLYWVPICKGMYNKYAFSVLYKLLKVFGGRVHIKVVFFGNSPWVNLLGTPETSFSGLNTLMARSVLRSSPLASSSSSSAGWPPDVASSEFSLKMVIYL